MVNWISPNDRITWDENFADTGRCKFIIEYVCLRDDLGSQVVLSVGDQSLKTNVEAPFDEPLYDAHDRAPRAGELQKPWGKMEIGSLRVKKGQTKIILSAYKMKAAR